MSEETKAALAAVQNMQAEGQKLIDALSGVPGEIAKTTRIALRRLEEASMLLGLAAGGTKALHPNVQSLAQTMTKAGDTARVLLDLDIDYTDLTDVQVDGITNQLTLAEHAYQEFRVLGALALLNLSRSFELREGAASAAQPPVVDELP